MAGVFIAPDVEHLAKDHEGLKLMPVSLISHLKVLQSPNEGSVGATTIDSDELLVRDWSDVLSLSESLSVHCGSR